MWPDPGEEILAGDQVVMLAYVTPAKGVVMSPVTNFGLHDREAGTVSSVNSSVGVWRKLDRIRANPHVALAFHTREHGRSDRPEYVLVQGRATLGAPVPDYPRTIEDEWVRAAGWQEDRGLWRWWLRVYRLRVQVDIAAERVVVWPDLRCAGSPEVHGAPLPGAPPEPQRAPRGGTGPRVDHRRVARRAAALPHALLGWVGADGFPVALPVHAGAGADAGERGVRLHVPAAGLVPPGGRRAGLTAHWFARHVIGQHQRVYTGWMESEGEGRVLYAPHTEAGYRFPRSRTLYRIAAGYGTRRGLRPARAAGIAPGGRNR